MDFSLLYTTRFLSKAARKFSRSAASYRRNKLFNSSLKILKEHYYSRRGLPLTGIIRNNSLRKGSIRGPKRPTIS